MVSGAQDLGQLHPWLPPAFVAWHEGNYTGSTVVGKRIKSIRSIFIPLRYINNI